MPDPKKSLQSVIDAYKQYQEGKKPTKEQTPGKQPPASPSAPQSPTQKPGTYQPK